eukprot:Seg2252.3 transcript_id=Seg2252.3/GoldUCD/mRNA.D3Y31 product="hypothetical protein" protein_id=Seg2252.3/GoldUCD/D3Y31
MASKKEPSWKEHEHSNAKRVILRKYLQAYIPVIGSKNETINITDFFAGPGEYFGQVENGAKKLGNEMNVDEKPKMTLPPKEKGSPMIALHAAKGYFEEQIRRRESEDLSASGTVTHIRLFYGEAREDRIHSLQQRVQTTLRQQDSNWEILYENTDMLLAANGGFTIEIIYVECKFENFPVDSIPEDEPTFAFIDPFGYKAIPFDLIQQLCSKRRMEVFINLMVQPLQRGIGRAMQLDSLSESITAALGTDEWKMIASEDKITGDQLAHIYTNQLKKKAGMRFTLDFIMRNISNVRLYHLIFATNHIMGVRCMKEAMNRVTQDEVELSFSSFLVNKQLKEVSWSNEQDNAKAARMIYQNFKGKTVYVRASNEHAHCAEMSVEGFLLLQTPFVFRSEQLKRMFNDRKIKLNHSLLSNRNTFPEKPCDGIPCTVTFMAEGEIFEYSEFIEMLNTEMIEKAILVDDGRHGYKYENVRSLFKHSVLSVKEDGSEVQVDKHLKSLASGLLICYKKDGSRYKEFTRKGHNHKNQECIMCFVCEIAEEKANDKMEMADQEERPAIQNA